MSNPLATARQLWRLNKDGRLALVDGPATPIPSVVADQAIKQAVQQGDAMMVAAVDEAFGGTPST